MVMNPYEVLGVKPTASSTEIKTAYYIKAKKHHPDVGGNPETFKTIKLAYDTLTDPAKKALYDSEGIVESDPESQRHLIAVKMLKQLFVNTLQNVNPDEIAYFDILGTMKQTIANGIIGAKDNVERLNQSEKQTAKAVKVLEKKLKRKNHKYNFLMELLLEQLHSVPGQILNMKNEISIQEIMLKLLNEYSYDPETKESVFATCTPRYFYNIPCS